MFNLTKEEEDIEYKKFKEFIESHFFDVNQHTMSVMWYGWKARASSDKASKK